MTDDPLPPAPMGPVDATEVPRFAGPATFARLPTAEQAPPAEITRIAAAHVGYELLSVLASTKGTNDGD